ncbi:dienelactone hydrolase family protein [Pseudonocardia sp. CA-142604]|uniref:dienelactone hydrolase family protein n=1 Tax=Pseudonocardia sp. CA-142604 TaxID=3240024 RepID=UPI003D94157B
MQAHGKEYAFHRYDEAGHAFFSVDMPLYRPASAIDGWKRVETFFATHLSGED